MDASWDQLRSLATQWPSLSDSDHDEALQQARSLCPTVDELPQLLELADAFATRQAQPAATEATSAASHFDTAGAAVLDALLLKLAGQLDLRGQHDLGLSDAALARSAELYGRLGRASRARYVLLQILALDGRPRALAAFADRIVEDPPGDPREIGMAFLPLFQQGHYAAGALFPRLLDSLARPETATLALEVANHAVAQQILAEHPARSRSSELATLLGGVIQRLLQIEERPQDYPGTPDQARQAVADWIALCLALCHALGLAGDASVSGKLEQALGVGHRRLRVEAAAALARLGAKRGLEVLVESAAEPATRTRALTCLEELGEAESVPADHRTPMARAAGELAEWLARPAHFGLPPISVEVVDHCRQFWPGSSEAVDCYLVSFEYCFPQGEYSNVGIVGPVTNALTADLEELVPSDVYAVFAGWQAEHPEIQEQDAASLSDAARQAAGERLQVLAEQGFARLELVKAGVFFGEPLLVATAQRQGVPGTVIVDGPKVEWYPGSSSRRSIGPQEAYWMHKGRKLLAAFNPASE